MGPWTEGGEMAGWVRGRVLAEHCGVTGHYFREVFLGNQRLGRGQEEGGQRGPAAGSHTPGPPLSPCHPLDGALLPHQGI